MFFCINYNESVMQKPLQIREQRDQQKMFDALPGFEKSINIELDRDLEYFSAVYKLLCENLIESAKRNNREPSLKLDDFADIFAFKIFVA
ncbi:MAG: hypothetical protein MHMPM18_004572 [Marteilia pararefringens]